MNIATLKAELIKRGMTPNPKHRKGQLQKALKDAVKNSIFCSYTPFWIIIFYIMRNRTNHWNNQGRRRETGWQQWKEKGCKVIYFTGYGGIILYLTVFLVAKLYPQQRNISIVVKNLMTCSPKGYARYFFCFFTKFTFSRLPKIKSMNKICKNGWSKQRGRN